MEKYKIYSEKINFLKTEEVSKTLLVLNAALAGLYFVALTFLFPRGNMYLFGILVAGEIFHIWQLITYTHTIWSMKHNARFASDFKFPVDIFITVAGEPLDIIEGTVSAAKNMRYSNFNVYILNDGYVAKKDNWKEVEELARRLQVHCITRTKPGGAKAGNINHALQKTSSPFVAVFDADHVPHKNFLKKTMGYFADPKMGFVQTPQYYKNNKLNYVTGGAWEQQELFFGAICKGKNRLNAVFMCGTNMVIRRKALEEVGGLNETNITEDFLTSQYIHEKGWRSIYVSQVLAEGLAPEDLLSYYKQQYRWARGSLELIFKHNAFLKKGLNWPQKIQYIASASFYLSGWVVLMNAALPLIFFFTGESPFVISTAAMAAVFLPFIFSTVYILLVSSNFSYTYRAVAFSLSAFMIHIKAFIALIIGRRETFQITPKKQQSGNFAYLAAPHLAYIILAVMGMGFAIAREGLTASVATNISWALFNIGIFIPFIIAALPESTTQPIAKALKKAAISD